jgi:beta-galactosamide-alpha-2,3-sialyltransferase
MSGCLIICRTPLQANIAKAIIECENLKKYTIIYVSHDMSERDFHAYDKIQHNAERSEFIYSPRLRCDILTSLATYKRVEDCIGDESYSSLFVASIDSIFVRGVVKSHTGTLMTFDDGAANILAPGAYDSAMRLRDYVYQWILRLPSQEDVIKRSVRHFTIYKDNHNILERERVTFIPLFEGKRKNIKGKAPISIFVGQPFEEFLSPKEIDNLKEKLMGIHLDYYVKHPREKRVLLDNIALLETGGEIAEIAIASTFRDNYVSVYGSFSSVLLNIPPAEAKKYYISAGDKSAEYRRVELCKAAGCEIIILGA